MMLFRIDHMDWFLDLTNFVHKSPNNNNRTVDLKCSRAKFSLVVSRQRRPARCIIELQITPQFFSLFHCNQILRSTIFAKDFFSYLFQMKETGFPFMTFCLMKGLGHLNLTFVSQSGHESRETNLPLLISYEEVDVGVINYGTFVSIDSLEFLRMLVLSDDFYVLVTLSKSRVTFTWTRYEFTFKKEKRECIIGGVATGYEYRFVIIFNPIESFYSLVSLRGTRRVWLFMSTANTHGIIIIPNGLYARYVVYSS